MHSNDVTIHEPCHQNWGAMSGGDSKRFCGSCTKQVHDLSALTESEAAQVLQEPDVCVRYTSDSRGNIVFKTARTFTLFAMLTSTASAAGAVTNAGPVQRVVDWVQSWFQTEQIVVMGEFAVPVEIATPQEIPETVEVVPEPERHPIRMGKPIVRARATQTTSTPSPQ